MKHIRNLMTIMMFAFAFVLFFNNPMEAEAATAQQETVYSMIFDPGYYYLHNPDVQATIGWDNGALLDHYIDVGAKESRSASRFFNITAYAQRYPELLAEYGTDLDKYVEHYVYTGIYNGEIASADGTELSQPEQWAFYQRLNGLITTSTTRYQPDTDRASNVELAAASINGTVLQPGETFSYNKVVGPRTSERGYKIAPVYINGEHSEGLGGGVCQVSSTIYAGLKYAGLKATERHEHSLPVNYLPSGYDATVAYGSLDLKFKNTFDKPIVIETKTDRGILTINIRYYDAAQETAVSTTTDTTDNTAATTDTVTVEVTTTDTTAADTTATTATTTEAAATTATTATTTATN